MTLAPHLSSGVFSQLKWPGVGSDYDECWALADMMAVHAVAAWASLPTATEYRAAAGNPDLPGATGGTIQQSGKAIRALWPKLAIEVSQNGLTWAQFVAKVKAGHVASLSVLSSALPLSYRYGFNGTHRVTVAYVGRWLIANPLAQPHDRYRDITEAQLKAAVDAYPGDGVSCILMPTPDEAFKTHPSYTEPDCTDAVDAATAPLRERIAGIKAKVAANAADVAND